jgi:hypothetical protein
MGQLFLEMKMSRSQRKPLNSSKKPQKKLEDPRRSRPHRKIIKEDLNCYGKSNAN